MFADLTLTYSCLVWVVVAYSVFKIKMQ